MGTHRHTGKRIEGLAELHQSVSEVLRTPERTRPLSPGFGLGVLGLQDQPMDARGRARLTNGVQGALGRHEPRVTVDRVRLEVDETGRVDSRVECSSNLGRIDAGLVEAHDVDAARLRYPTATYGQIAYDDAGDVWAPFVGGVEMVGLGTPPDAFGDFPAFDGSQQLETDLALQSLSTATPWTVAVMVGLVSSPDDGRVFGLHADGDAEPWLEVRVSTGANLELVARDAAESIVLTQSIASGPDSTLWLWGYPGRVAASIGPDATPVILPGGVSETESRLVLGSPSAGAIWIAARAGIWPRVLTRRERMAVGAFWEAELA